MIHTLSMLESNRHRRPEGERYQRSPLADYHVWNPIMDDKKQKHDDTSISLHPLTFEQAIRVLAQPRRTDSQAEGSDKTKSPDPETDASKRKTVRRRKPS